MAIILRNGNDLSAFTGEEYLSGGQRMSLDTALTKSAAELAAFGLFISVPFVAPVGKVITGSPRYVIAGDNITINEQFNVINAPPPPDPGTLNPYLVGAAFDIDIASGDVQAIGNGFNLIAATYNGVGKIQLLFTNPVLVPYYATIHGDAPSAKVVEYNPEYLNVETRSSVGGPLIDATRITVQCYSIPNA